MNLYRLKSYLNNLKKIKRNIILFFITFPTLLVCLPIVLLVTGSVMDNGELWEHLSPVFSEAAEYISWKIVPDYPTFGN